MCYITEIYRFMAGHKQLLILKRKPSTKLEYQIKQQNPFSPVL